MVEVVDKHLKDEVNRLHAQICGALADPTRILILYSISHGARSVGEIVNILDTSQPTISRHLKVLRDRNLVNSHREGTNVYYELADQRIIQALNLLREVMAGMLRKQVSLIEETEGPALESS